MKLESGQQNDATQIGRLNRYLSAEIRTYIEQNYYAKVEKQAQLDYLIGDREFLADPSRHVGLYSDHGVVHVRDVAQNILQILETVAGVLIPESSDYIRSEGMKAYGVMLAYVHDIGMRDFSAFGRFMHPEFAAQEVFGPEFDEIIDVIWDDNCGNISWGLVGFFEEGLLTQEPKLILREMLAMAVAHSKSKVPIAVLNDPVRFRALMVQSISVNLHHLYHDQQVARAEEKAQRTQLLPTSEDELQRLSATLRSARAGREAFRKSEQVPGRSNENVARFYDDVEREAFQWFLSEQEVVRLLFRDAIDVVRTLRVADALRQRGAVLRTSGGYRISVDQNSARAVYTLQKASGETFLVEGSGAIGAGEANIASSELSPTGDLWISFQRGSFADQETVRRAARNVAMIVDDIQRDIIDTFRRSPASRATKDNAGLKSNQDIRIYIENTDDNLIFADIVKEELDRIAHDVGDKTEIMPSLKNIATEERERYLGASDLNWSRQRKEQALLRIAQSGHKVAEIDPDKAFRNVRVTHLKEGEVLINADSPHGFVYVSTSGRLLSFPRGGYKPFEIEAWSLIGRNSVITGDMRSDTNTALSDGDFLMIPKETYLKHWHYTYHIDEFIDILERVYQQDRDQEFDHLLDILEQVVMIDGNLADGEIELLQAFTASHGIEQSTEAIRARLLTGERADVATLRDSVLDYLAMDPSYLQVARFIDLLRLLVRRGKNVTSEEVSTLAELDSLLIDYLDDKMTAPDGTVGGVTRIRYQVILVPQSTDQDQEIRDLLPNALKLEQGWGNSYLLETYYSEGFANLVCERYRALGYYAVVEKN